ncbi:hypothetical protein H2O64_21035 [Kordia sp. YSTF-M3]|uniref:Extracellular endo-alpha-(1->5)-L-arabinanase C-terminal domain-containing protein n=1 Tax=Kordia aestuariivivens TaxID=2759037 RepID=A0ABR7QF89_9FLAO|nr:hypothetical protein [Kordia aestuariivivens]MBC8757168.1 hypothetical protein [Kordia aestuariivivens]
MKYTKAILLTVCICSFLSFQTTDSLVGKWELYKLEGSDGVEKEMNGRWMEFLEDGSLKGGNSPETTDRTGKWTYDEATKALWFGSEKNIAGEGTYTINWIDENTINFTVGEGRKVHLKRKTEK